MQVAIKLTKRCTLPSISLTQATNWGIVEINKVLVVSTFFCTETFGDNRIGKLCVIGRQIILKLIRLNAWINRSVIICDFTLNYILSLN